MGRDWKIIISRWLDVTHQLSPRAKKKRVILEFRLCSSGNPLSLLRPRAVRGGERYSLASPPRPPSPLLRAPPRAGNPSFQGALQAGAERARGGGPAGPSPPSEGWGGPRAGVVASPPFSSLVLISGIDRKLQGQLNALRYRVLVRPERLQTAPQSLGGLRRRRDLWPALTPKSAEGNPCRRGGSAAPPPAALTPTHHAGGKGGS